MWTLALCQSKVKGLKPDSHLWDKRNTNEHKHEASVSLKAGFR